MYHVICGLFAFAQLFSCSGGSRKNIRGLAPHHLGGHNG